MRTTDQPEVHEQAPWSRPELRVLDVGGSAGKAPDAQEFNLSTTYGLLFAYGPS